MKKTVLIQGIKSVLRSYKGMFKSGHMKGDVLQWITVDLLTHCKYNVVYIV